MADQEEPKDSGILASIREYMMSHGGLGGSDNRDYDIAMGFDTSSGTAKGYAMGGVVTPDDLGLGSVPVPSQMTPAAAPVPPPVSPLQGILNQSQGLGAQLAGQYTPEKRNDLYAALLERQNSTPSAIGSGLASVGDAIARGYGRDQTNFLDKTLQGQKQTREEGLGAFDTAQKGTMAQNQAGMEFGKMDPTSNISKMTQEAYSGAMEKLGFKPEQISKMPASQIEMLANVALKNADIESQKELKKATIELQAMMGNATIRNQQLERAQRQQEIEAKKKQDALDADKEAQKHWLTHPLLAHQAGQRLAQGAGESAPQATSGGPHGSTVTQNGHTYTWNPATKKYE